MVSPTTRPFGVLSSIGSPSSPSTSTQSPFSTPPFTLRDDRQPLKAAKLISASPHRVKKKGVNFSLLNQTQVFNSDDPLFSPRHTPSSIRSYASGPSSDHPASESTPIRAARLARPILKSTDPQSIRIAKSTREGSMANRETARHIVTGLVTSTHSSSSLASLCDGAEDGVAGNSHVPESDPSSDDGIAPSEADADGATGNAGLASDEEEEQAEELHPSALVDVILEGAADLLTLEEAYTTLTLRLREVLYDMGPPTCHTHENLMSVLQPISDEAPAVVRAMSRDLSRLMGKVPQCEAALATSSPFRSLKPDTRRTGLLSPDSTPSKGFTASEVLYRREAASVGCAALRFLSVIYSTSLVFTCFTEADLQYLLDQVLVIPKTPSLPTPQPRRTYAHALLIFSNLGLPEQWVSLAKDKIIGAIDSAFNTIGAAPHKIRDPTCIRREAFLAVNHLVDQYPRLFFPAYPQFLSACLRGLRGQHNLRRNATAAASAFVTVKLRLLQVADQQVECGDLDIQEWTKTHTLARKSEQFVVNFLKSAVKVQENAKTTEWDMINGVLRSTVGLANEVGWACTAWAVLVSLMGQSYNSSSQLEMIDHIMDRSLQGSANVIRPTLARAAWQHAIHAYLLSSTIAAVSDTGKVVMSHLPFTASSYQDVPGRVGRILFPINLALDKANNPQSFARAVVSDPTFNGERRCAWQRSEKSRRFGWMITAGAIAPAIVFAYTVLALEHVEPKSKDLSQLSGLLSSDGPEPDITPEEDRIPRLDKTFDFVVLPLLQGSFSVCGVDELKVQAWEILEAITAPISPSTSRPRLDRLLSTHFLDGDMLGGESPEADCVAKFDNDRIVPSEIPAWGKVWVAKRLGKLLALFQDALNGIHGLQTVAAAEWVSNANGLVLIPKTLSRVWCNLLQALAITNSESGPTPLFVVGLQAVTKVLIQVFDSDPAKYLPVQLLNSEGKVTLDTDVVRLGIVLHLYEEAVKALGQKTLGTTHIDATVSQTQAPGIELKHEPVGYSTVAGYLLGHIIRTDLLSATAIPDARDRLCVLVRGLLDASSVLGTRALGDLTNMWIFEGKTALPLDLWLLLAQKWTDMVDLQPSDAASQTNHTGALMVSLLSGPFRDASNSTWFSQPTEDSMLAWNNLLKATILRFRAKRVGSNFGVLETLSAHLEDFLLVDDADETIGRRASTTTLRCLASATAWISFAPPEHYHLSHYSINENYVPADFLTLVGESLSAAYPCSDHSVRGLIDSLVHLLNNVTADVVSDVIEPLRGTLAKWMKAKSSGIAASLDDLYIASLDALTRAIQEGSIPASSDTINSYIDVYADRLNHGTTAAVLLAFQSFWNSNFEGRTLELSDDAAYFLRDVVSALPGFIVVEGLEGLESESEPVRYPCAESLPSQPAVQLPAVEASLTTGADQVAVHVPATPEVKEATAAVSDSPNVAPTAHDASASPVLNSSLNYDADISQSPRSGTLSTKPRPTELVPASSPAVNIAPKASVESPRGSSGLSQVRSSAKSHSSPNLANDTFFGTDPESSGNDGGLSDDAANAKSSLFTHASRWLRKVPSFGLFSASQQEEQHLLLLSQPGSPRPARSQSIGPVVTPRRLNKASSPYSMSDSGSTTSSPARTKSSRRRRLKRRETETLGLGGDGVELQSPSVSQSQPAVTCVSPATTRSAARRKRGSEAVEEGTAKKRRTMHTPSKIDDSDQAEDELLLSAASALRSRQEEQAAIASEDAEKDVTEDATITVEATDGQSGAPQLDDAQKEEEEEVNRARGSQPEALQPESGVFDDAMEDESPPVAHERAPTPTADLPSPARRTATQSRLLGMISDAAQNEEAVKHLDLEGITELVSNLNRLKAAAEESLLRRAAEARTVRRSRSD